MVGASVASITDNEATENINNTTPSAYSASDPAKCAPIAPPTTNFMLNTAAALTTKPFAKILATTISVAVTGITSKCSIVPRSRSRITAAPTNTNVINIILLPAIAAPINQLLWLFGLYCRFTAARTGMAWLICCFTPMNSWISWLKICVI